jgi:hypothetical protein
LGENATLSTPPVPLLTTSPDSVNKSWAQIPNGPWSLCPRIKYKLIYCST